MTTTTDTNDRMSIPEVLSVFRESPFNLSPYRVDISLHHFFKNISMYTHGEEHLFEGSNNGTGFTLDQEPKRIFECVPAFQRDNDKWTEEMQVSFILNLLSGCPTVLMFYEVAKSVDTREQDLTSCKLIDGLQRLTAIYRFLTNEIKVLGYTYQELTDNRVMVLNRITVKISNYAFQSEIEAVQFYISMNENISHSKEDIGKARAYLAELIAKEAADVIENKGV